MSFWTDVRDPLFFGAPGLAYDAAAQKGGFEGPPVPQPGNPYSGMPQYPDYNKVYDPSTMSVAPGVNAGLSTINPNEQGLDAYRAQATRSGPSAWADLATTRSYADEARARDMNAKDAQSGAATAEGNIAMHGGLRSGATERVQTSANRDMMGNDQNAANQGGLNRQQIGINDEQNRITQLGQLPGMELNKSNFDLTKLNTATGAKEADITNQLNENKNFNAYNMAKYNTQGQIWGAGKQADATAQSGGGSWICTEAKKMATKDPEWGKKDAAALKKLTRYARNRHVHGARFYLYQCKTLVERMHAAGDVDWKEVLKFVRLVIYHVERNKMDQAFTEFVKYTRDMIDKYWPECDNPVYLQIRKAA